jgi:LEA14-like dessication related protein
VAIRVQNPNPVGVNLKEIPFLVLIRHGDCFQEIANGNTGNVSIPARDSTILTVPVISRNSVILRALAAFVARGGIEVMIKGNAVVDAFVTGWSVPFEKTVKVTAGDVVNAFATKNQKK